MKIKNLDPSLICFMCVILSAIPVVILRAKTYSLGYELGKLKTFEKELHQQNLELKLRLASVQRSTRDKYLAKSNQNPETSLHLPRANLILNSMNQAKK